MPARVRKIAIMGFRSVGKSSITIQFVENQFVDSYDPTIENMKIRGQDYQLDLIDTAGQDEYSLVPQSYIMNIDGYVLVYSVTSYKSLEVVKVIYEKLLDMTGKKQVPLVLVGNKTDLRMEREVSADEGKRLAEQWRAAFCETSAKENQKINELFTSVILEIEKSEGNNLQEKGSCILS
ncbi:hypothetical protein LSH36_284g03007 [Paralvinella palmiformis]|uniref:GTP-binding protein Rheb n=1 Tax=Paralvinella palmiformis TaxID=53620 RepID=A0AAD9N4C3_9ANNE|nr:hypothetical protein LSH36_284g03007 [Paralvinella palmiformis]